MICLLKAAYITTSLVVSTTMEMSEHCCCVLMSTAVGVNVSTNIIIPFILQLVYYCDSYSLARHHQRPTLIQCCIHWRSGDESQ